MAQQGKELAAERDKVSLTPGTHMGEGEKQLQQVDSDLCFHVVTPTHLSFHSHLKMST